MSTASIPQAGGNRSEWLVAVLRLMVLVRISGENSEHALGSLGSFSLSPLVFLGNLAVNYAPYAGTYHGDSDLQLERINAPRPF